MIKIISFLVFMAGCITATPPPPKEIIPQRAASGKFFKMANKICQPYGGVAFVLPGEVFSAECRDGLEVRRKRETMQKLKAEK